MSQSYVSDEDIDMQQQLENFEKMHDDNFDCVEIHKQYAFENPLLRHHSIQMEPSSHLISKLKESSLNDDGEQLPLTRAQCPEGTVPIRKKYMKNSLQSETSPLGEKKLVEHVAALSMEINNTGITGVINVWEPKVVANQFSAAFIYVAGQDGPDNNMIVTGWAVNTYDYPETENYTALYAYWTRDGGKTTGCVDTICPGFVQINRDISLGMRLKDISKQSEIRQISIPLHIKQDFASKNWWIFYKFTPIGYYPKELFTTLSKGATHGGWGGQVDSPPNVPTPAMGSGLLPEASGQVCYIEQMMLYDERRAPIYPCQQTLKEYNTKSQCYGIYYFGTKPVVGHHMELGGRPDCRN
ncbi:hypothetical protein vseg_020203 [Gypsophila vaccaria]